LNNGSIENDLSIYLKLRQVRGIANLEMLFWQSKMQYHDWTDMLLRNVSSALIDRMCVQEW
jgi:hypothetical protein